MKLNDLKDNNGSRKSRLRVGRGIGSGKGKTGGRGVKGQKSRSGVAIKGFEGGQMPIYMRLPKRGFNNVFRKSFSAVNLGRVQGAIDAKRLDGSKVVDQAALVAAGLARKNDVGVRLLAKGELKAKVTFKVAHASAAATAAVEKAGGKVEIVEVKAPAEPKADAKASKKPAAKKAEKKADTAE